MCWIPGILRPADQATVTEWRNTSKIRKNAFIRGLQKYSWSPFLFLLLWWKLFSASQNKLLLADSLGYLMNLKRFRRGLNTAYYTTWTADTSKHFLYPFSLEWVFCSTIYERVGILPIAFCLSLSQSPPLVTALYTQLHKIQGYSPYFWW